MSLEEWQVALRREFGRQQKFRLKNLGREPVFSEFEVRNPATRRTYRVAIRGAGLGDNFCSCPDFAVNTLGTCKHIEFTLAALERKAGAKKALGQGFQPPYSEVYLRYGSKREVCFRPGEDCPAALRKLANRYFDAHERLRPAAYSHFHRFLDEAAKIVHELRYYDDALGLVAQVRDQQRLVRQVDQLFPGSVDSPAWKKLLNADLYPYQREGALFAARAGRCLLADDMGLGKTLQAIAATEILARAGGVGRVLIICPTSLKHQWQREIERFAPRPAVVVEGLLARRAALYAADSFYKITNYDVVRRDLTPIQQWRPDLIILDEAQRIKNWKTRTAQSVKQLASPYAFVLTGTPLENRLEELHSIVEFVDRFRLGPMFRFLHEHQHTNENGQVIGYRNLSRISETLAPILIRRTKDRVLKELPARMEKHFFLPITPQQEECHEENRQNVAQIVAKWRRFGFLTETDQQRLMISLQNMRMACDSTYLLDHKTDFGTKIDELVTLLGEMLEDPQTKVVIFSQWLRMHELVVARLKKQKWQHVLFHGGVPGPQRRKLIDRFREEPDCRLFLSTDAGGVGLNLQHASAVVNLDQPWNPAVLEQRIGRVHRLGQRRPVRVVHLVAQGTIEEQMLGLLKFKKSVFTGVFDKGENEVFLGATRLKRFMDSVEKVTEAASQASPVPPTPAPVAPEEKPARSPRSRPGGRPAQPAPQQLWSELASVGATLLDKLGHLLRGNGSAPGGNGRSSLALTVSQDEATGQPCLKLPLPKPETTQKLLGLLAEILQGR
jgi:superfamily II DNA or RNA helicase